MCARRFLPAKLAWHLTPNNKSQPKSVCLANLLPRRLTITCFTHLETRCRPKGDGCDGFKNHVWSFLNRFSQRVDVDAVGAQ